METIIRDHLMKHLLKKKLISDFQYGFRPGRSSRLEFGDRQPANAGQKYLLTCHPAFGRQEIAGQPIPVSHPNYN